MVYTERIIKLTTICIQDMNCHNGIIKMNTLLSSIQTIVFYITHITIAGKQKHKITYQCVASTYKRSYSCVGETQKRLHNGHATVSCVNLEVSATIKRVSFPIGLYRPWVTNGKYYMAVHLSASSPITLHLRFSTPQTPLTTKSMKTLGVKQISSCSNEDLVSTFLLLSSQKP